MAPRTAEQNRALRDASRERLLGAAMRLFSRHGYSATSIRKIAEEAGVAQGLLYSHFRGKEELLKALFQRSMDDVRESFAAGADAGRAGADAGKAAGAAAPAFDGAAGAGTGPRSPLERLVASALAILKRNLEFWRLSYGVRMQEEVVEVLGPDLKLWTREILGALEAHFRANAASGAAEARVQAALFFAAFDGICQHFVLDPENYPLEAVSRSLLERFAPPTRPKGDAHGKRRRG